LSLGVKEQEQEIIALQTQILELRKQSSRVWEQIDSHRYKVAVLIGNKEKIISYAGYYLVFVLWLMFVFGVSKFGEIFSLNLTTISLFLSIFSVLVIPLIAIKFLGPSYESKIVKYSKLIDPLLVQTREIYSDLFDKESKIQQLELLIKGNKGKKTKF
jgi:hypothetical protein